MKWIIIAVIMLCQSAFADALDVDRFIEGFKHIDNEPAITCHSDSFSIIRGNSEFHFAPGEISLFKLGGDRFCVMHYDGNCRFVINPPDKVEQAQMLKFTKHEKLDNITEAVTIFFTIPFNDILDTLSLSNLKEKPKVQNNISEVIKDAYDHIGIDLSDMLLNDLLTDGPGTYFYADFNLEDIGHLIFCEDPYRDDVCQLYKLRLYAGIKMYDYLCGYSPESDLPSQRGMMPVDITHYDINSKIESNGKMIVNCRVHYTPLRMGRRYLLFSWYNKNELHSAFDSNGDSLKIIHRNIKGNEDYDIGIILNNSAQLGKSDFIDINFECESLDNRWGVYYIKGQTYWYPRNIIRDVATYKLTYNYPKKYEVVSCGNLININTEKGRTTSEWTLDEPVNYVSFNIGAFDSKEITAENLPPVRVYLAKYIPHSEIAPYLTFYGIASTKDMLGQVGADIINSTAFFSSVIAPCPFDTIKVTEIPRGHGQGSPGLIHLSWSTFQTDDMEGLDEKFRAHETAHQWWGHMVDNESYRDVWITEGLAEYCGFWFYQMSSKDKKACTNMLKNIRSHIFKGVGKRSTGAKAGPVVMGYRLNSSESNDYSSIVYNKGAYIFHMIRYFLYDYKNSSDDAFALFLNDLTVKFKYNPITTRDLKDILDNHTGIDMSWFFDQWVYGTDIPEYRFSFSAAKTREGKYKVECYVKQLNVPDDFMMIVPLTAVFDNNRYVHLKVLVDKPDNIIELPLLPHKPEKIIFNTYDAVLAKVKYE